jgi:hypothetical protein
MSTFPDPPTDAIQSFEPADVEEDTRRGYYTDYTREEVINHYKKQLESRSYFIIPSIRLNYPPEEAQTIIRDQTRSTYLEELVYPMRESLFINGFEPTLPQDLLLREDKYWDQKIIVKKVSSNWFARLAVGLAIIGVIPILAKMIIKSLYELKNNINNIPLNKNSKRKQ